MRIIKLIVIALILGLTGIIYAAGGQQTPADGKSRAAQCCARCGDSCCMKEQKSGDAKAAHKSCDMNKTGEGCCKAKADCCKAGGAECCQAGAECCKAGDSTCCAHMSQDKQGKAQACDMQKDGKGCGADCDCCKSGSCSKEKAAQQ
jgi:hypothetical protein